MDKGDYYKYITSDEWWEKTKEVRKRNDGHCEVCNRGFAAAVHHRHYRTLYNENTETDLLLICNRCHAHVHEKRSGLELEWKSIQDKIIKLREELKE